MRLYQRCTAPSPHDRPTFEALMRDLAFLESRVRVEGARISRECSRWGTRSGLEMGFRRLGRRLERGSLGRGRAWGTHGGHRACVAVCWVLAHMQMGWGIWPLPHTHQRHGQRRRKGLGTQAPGFLHGCASLGFHTTYTCNAPH